MKFLNWLETLQLQILNSRRSIRSRQTRSPQHAHLRQIDVAPLAESLEDRAQLSPLVYVEHDGGANPLFGVDVGSYATQTFGDLDGDGDQDMIAGKNNGKFNFFQNTGTATNPVFAEVTGSANPVNGLDAGYYSTPALVDLDGDGKLDLVSGTLGDIKFFRNTGTLTAPSFSELTGESNPFNGIGGGNFLGVTLGDIDGDGDADLVLTRLGGDFRFFENTGTSTSPAFTEQLDGANPFDDFNIGGFAKSSLGDVDGDGDLDLFASPGYQTFLILNTGSATSPAFSLQSSENNPLSGLNTGNQGAPSIVDLDADGDADVVVGQQNGSFRLFKASAAPPSTTPGVILVISASTGSETFGTQITVTAVADFKQSTSQTVTLNVSGTGITSGDFTVSSPTITIGANQTRGSVTFTVKDDLLNEGVETATLSLSNPSAGLTLGSNTTQNVIIAEDYDVDGAVLPTYTEQTGAANPLNGFDAGSYVVPTFGDVDGDGDQDLIAGKNNGTFSFFRNTGTATNPVFSEVTGDASPVNGLDAGYYSTPALVDLDGDGKLDLVSGTLGDVRFFRNTGTLTSPTFSELSGSSNPFNGISGGNFFGVTLGDVDGDGDFDMVLGRLNGDFRFFENTGSTTSPAFTEKTGSANPLNGIVIGGFLKPTFGDIDSDGDLDLFASPGYQTNLILNAGTASTPAFFHQGSLRNPFAGKNTGNQGAPVLVDLDGDSDLDVVFGQQNGTFRLFKAAPELGNAPTVANAISDQNATEDSSFSFQFSADTFTDIDVGATLTYSATKSDGSALPSWLTFTASTRTFSGTPLNADVGTLSIKVTATDNRSQSVSDTFNLVVANTNDAPTLAHAIADQNAAEDSAFTFTFATDTFADVDASDSLTLIATQSDGSALPGWLTFTAATRTFSGTPLNANVATVSIKVTATDSGDASVSDTFELVVSNTNDAPTVANAIADQNATEDSPFALAFAANTFAEVDAGDSLTLTATRSDGSALPSWLTFTAATHTFSGTPLNSDVGTLSIKVTATDSNHASVNDTFNLVVANTNDAPTLAHVIADQNATEGSAFTLTFAADTFADVDEGDLLTLTATRSDGSALPSWLTFTAATRTFSGTPQGADLGTLSIKVTATDTSHASVSETFSLAAIGTQVVLSDGSVAITDVGGASNDSIGLSMDDDHLVVTLDGVTTEIPLTGLTELVITGGGGDDTLNVDLSHGPLPFNIVFLGGNGGFDTLNVTGFDESGLFTSYTANFTNRNDGNIQYRNGNTVLTTLTYTGLEPITIAGTPTEIIFNLPSTNDTDVRLLDIGGADGIMRLTGSTFETTDFSIAAATSITINANAGNDRITIQGVDASYSGQLIVNGGAGNDVLTATASAISVMLIGDAGNDTLTGSTHDDTLTGGLGNDVLNGGSGIDTVAETTSENLILTNTQLTGNGNDKLTSIERANLNGNAANNLLDASGFTLGNVTLLGGNGNDTLIGGAFTGAAGNDGFNDSLDGGAGTDVVRQSSRTSQTFSIGPTPGTNVVTGASSNAGDLWTSIESLHFIGSGTAATTLDASLFTGSVTLAGGSGNDTLIGGRGSNVLNGNAGRDSLIGGDGNDTLNGGTGNDTLRGNAGDDRMFGDEGNDKLFGGNGQDLMDGGVGSDVLTGEVGNDTINGGAGNDAISGGSGDDLLNGGLGNDSILGGTGNDLLRSGGGSDYLSGESGDDRFAASGAHIIFGGGVNAVSGSSNHIDSVFLFDFGRLLV